MSLTSCNAHLAYVSNGFALCFLDFAAELLPKVGDCKDAIGALDGQVQRFFIIQVTLGVNK